MSAVDPAQLAALQTPRGRAKASRRTALLTAAAHLFALRGYNGVSIEDLGAAAGISGPAVYRHFDGKQAVLSALLAGASQDLYDGGQTVVAESPDSAEALRGLIEFQVDFALSHPDVIRVHDRELSSLSTLDERTVRSLQKKYVEVWVAVLARLHPNADKTELRIRAHATFGLINSTPHTTHRSRTSRDVARARHVLEQMALSALQSG